MAVCSFKFILGSSSSVLCMSRLHPHWA